MNVTVTCIKLNVGEKKVIHLLVNLLVHGHNSFLNKVILYTFRYTLTCFMYKQTTFAIYVADNICSTFPCSSRGTCEPVGTEGFRCQCPPSWTGDTCENSKIISLTIRAEYTEGLSLWFKILQ